MAFVVSNDRKGSHPVRLAEAFELVRSQLLPVRTILNR